MDELNKEVPEDLRSTEELDSLADGLDVARNSERPMKASPKTDAAAPAAKDETFEFEYKGKKVRGTRDEFTKWASLGYDRPQVMAQFNQEKSKFEQDRQSWEQKWGVYRQIDDYANQNKEWWDFIQNQWQSRGQFQPGQPPGNDPAAANPAQPPPDPRFQTLEQKLSQLEQVLTQERQQAQAKKEDQELDEQIQSMREQYKHLDWQTLDENGKHLETRILEHAQQNGIKHFRVALRDLLHDELLAKAESQGKLAVTKGIQQKTKLGVLGESPTPQKGAPRANQNIRNTSYEAIAEDIKDELRRGVYGQ